MAILIIDSKDNLFLKSILTLVQKFKEAKAELIETNKSIEVVDDDEFLKEMIDASEGGVLDSDETSDFMKELKGLAE
ncbi:MAG: hypothetical protein JXR60_11535 [Bacteroidales bacterium]|nr:hypothetical protein [Bacteroidales bacterium]